MELVSILLSFAVALTGLSLFWAFSWIRELEERVERLDRDIGRLNEQRVKVLEDNEAVIPPEGQSKSELIVSTREHHGWW